MTTARPVFVDGAILAAADLSLMESTARDRDARHARHLHTPGVCAGLELVSEQRTTTSGADYVDVTLTAGYAVDGTGRELVVAADQQLSPDRFLADNPNPPKEPGETFSVWHPVFVRGLDAAVAGEAQPSTCANGGSRSSVEEIVEVEFGRPGDSDLDQPVPPPDAGPGDAAWRVLVGFVRLDTGINRFHEIGTSADGITVSGAGARAALVSASTGRLELRAGAAPSSGVPAVVVDADAGGSLTFGTHDGTGGIAPLLQVDSSGNLTAKGALKGVQTAGTVRVVSGTASDGTVLPLPAGVDQATIDSGGLEVSILLTPNLPDPTTRPNATSVFVPVVCEVDADRRVSCVGQWADVAAAALPPPVPASCDYLLLVAVPEDSP
jgi:hypothetical protein